MKYFLTITLAVFTLTFFLNANNAKAQGSTGTTAGTTSNTASTVSLPAKADDVSDAQLKDFIQKAQSSGMTDDEIRKAALARGMSETEVTKLQGRINILKTAKDVNAKDDQTRKVNGNDTEDKKSAGGGNVSSGGLGVFGAELFTNSNLSFEPNLRIPTPKNYRLGPDDQLVINVYGASQVDWKPTITADGNVQIPGIGLVHVDGKTIEQATQLIKSKLIAAHYSVGNGTTVSVTLGNIRSIKVIITGEVARPATYTISSLSTVFNALYASGGPNSIGSFRQIFVIRDNAVIRTLDTYDFLLKANQKDNVGLEDGDIIRVPTYKVRVALAGQVKHPAIFEVLPGETLRDVIAFAGGFNDVAYTANIKAIQLTDKDLKVSDIRAADYSNYIPLRGDSYTVDRILDSYENRVSIYGAVVRPGQFELEKGLTLSQLIIKAAGLKQDAFARRGFISRLKSDNTTELVAFDVKGVVNKTAPDVELKKEDVISIPSIFDLRDQYSVVINGEVRSPGTFSYADNMSVEDLIIQAGGITESGSFRKIEIARRVTTSDPGKRNTQVADISMIDVNPDYKVGGKPFILQPFDVVSVYTLPGYEIQKTVRVEGEVLYPGNYTIKSKDEKISDLVKRAGGLTAFADVDAGTLKRPNILGIDAEKEKVDPNAVQQEKTTRLQHLQKALRDSTTQISEQINNDFVGIDLKKILDNPGSTIDLVLEQGDVLRIPKEQQLVRVNGEVLFPSSIVYLKGNSLTDFVDNAGGFSVSALRRRAYVIYPNGLVKSTHTFLFFRSYPTVRPGSEIVIPRRPERRRISTAELSSIAGALASAAAVLIGVISLVRR